MDKSRPELAERAAKALVFMGLCAAAVSPLVLLIAWFVVAPAIPITIGVLYGIGWWAAGRWDL